MFTRKLVNLTLIVACIANLAACTSLGHEGRAKPKIAKEFEGAKEISFDADEGELSVALESYLSDIGIKPRIISAPQVRIQKGDKEYTYDEVQTRYVVRVRSTDLDICIPEGSRQMHFNISVTDFKERSRVFLMSGNFGCKNTIIRNFGNWIEGKKIDPQN
jgi:hypothetical protein